MEKINRGLRYGVSRHRQLRSTRPTSTIEQSSYPSNSSPRLIIECNGHWNQLTIRISRANLKIWWVILSLVMIIKIRKNLPVSIVTKFVVSLVQIESWLWIEQLNIDQKCAKKLFNANREQIYLPEFKFKFTRWHTTYSPFFWNVDLL